MEDDLLDMFVQNDTLADWAAELPALAGIRRLMRLVALAWHLRQRDADRSRVLLRDIEPLLNLLADDGAGLVQSIRARMLLIDAEMLWLSGRLSAAQQLASQAQAGFALAGDARGAADVHWLLAWVAQDQGHTGECLAQLDHLALAAAHSGDLVRMGLADAARAVVAVYADLPQAEARWGRHFPADLTLEEPALAAWISDFFGMRAFQSSDFGGAVLHLMRSYELALATGQLRRAINIAANIGNALTSLNAHDAALNWLQRALALARPPGWPMSMGLCLAQTAETLRQLGQGEAAQELLSEALEVLAPLSASRPHALALEYQGDLALERGDHVAALHSFTALDAVAATLQQTDVQIAARRGQAHALLQAQRPSEALTAAAAALQLARRLGDPTNQIATLSVLADIHARHALVAPASESSPTPALFYLQAALHLADSINGYTAPCSLLDAAAREYARFGDHARAYALAERSNVARDQNHSRAVTNRAVAMRLQHSTERARSDSAHHRELAAAQAQRAEALQQTSATLAHLSAIGQEITSHLDASAVYHALDRHVHALLDAIHFSIFLIDDDVLGEHGKAPELYCAYGVEAGKPLPATRMSLNDAQRNSVRCVRERREIVIDNSIGGCTPNLIPGTLVTLSLLFVPLLIGERVLGVMTVQSQQAQAFGEREQLIFRTLCAYGAIALDNSSAYRQVAATLKALNAAQAQLLEKNLELERAYGALEEVSLTDQLTGLRNRRFLLQHIDADVALCLRHHDDPLYQSLPGVSAAPGKDLVFFMVDLDHFKQVNDRHGHAAGDSVLIQMQERLREVFRESDYLVRWGGEEFLVVARATQRDDAGAVAERIRAAVAGRAFVLPGGAHLASTCSIGFASYPFLPAQPELMSWSQVMELADQALYLAKGSGRNAWAGLYATAHTRADGLFTRVLEDVHRCVADGDVALMASQAAMTAGAAAGSAAEEDLAAAMLRAMARD